MGKHAQESYVSTNFLTQANAASTYAPLASPTFTGTVTVPAPVNATDAVTKQYADAIAEGLHIHAAVGAATTTNINLSSPPATIDGVTLVDTMRVLVKDQGTTSENGIYVYNSASSSLTRALDFDTPAETDGGDFVFVTGGNTYDNTGWVQTETVTTIGTSPILFTQFSGAGTYTAGAGLFLNGTEFSNTGVLSLTGTANEVEVSASAGSITISLPSTINANTTGSAASLTTSRVIELSGDVSGSASFDGSANASISSTLANTAVTPATYGSASAVATVTVDSKGRVTSASNTPIAIAQSAVTNLASDLSQKQPLDSDLTAISNADLNFTGNVYKNYALAGSTWTTVTSNFGTTNINSIAYGNGLWVAVGGYEIRTSTNGSTWTTQSTPESISIIEVNYGNGQWVIAGVGASMMAASTSTDGLSWTTNSTLNLPYGGAGTPETLAYGNNLWVLGSYGGQIRTSTNGSTWTTVTSNFGTTRIRSIAYGNGLWVAGGNNGQMRTSTNGSTWTTVTSNFGTTMILAIAYGNGLWVAGDGNTGEMRTSTDGTTWTTITSNFSSFINFIAYGGDGWVAGAGSGQIRTSTNGITWTTVTSNFGTTRVTSLSYGNGLWVAGGFSGQIRTASGITQNSYSIDTNTYATLASPALTGTPTAPTAALGTNTTQIATTEFVESRFDTTTINTQTASYELVLADAGKTIEMNVASANNLTVPLNSSQAFPVGTTIDVIQYGAGQTTIVATGGVTIRSKESKLKLTGQYSGATLYKRGTDEWVVVGDLTT